MSPTPTSYQDGHGPVDMVVTLAVPAQLTGHTHLDKPAGTIVFRFQFRTIRDALGFIDTSDDIPGLLCADLLESHGDDSEQSRILTDRRTVSDMEPNGEYKFGNLVN